MMEFEAKRGSRWRGEIEHRSKINGRARAGRARKTRIATGGQEKEKEWRWM
jgi:hypothetical protein